MTAGVYLQALSKMQMLNSPAFQRMAEAEWYRAEKAIKNATKAIERALIPWRLKLEVSFADAIELR